MRTAPLAFRQTPRTAAPRDALAPPRPAALASTRRARRSPDRGRCAFPQRLTLGVARRLRAAARPGAHAGVLATILALVGCASPVRFPQALASSPAPDAARSDNARPAAGPDALRVTAYDLNGDRRPDYWQYAGTHGRTRAIAFASPGSAGPGARIVLDDIAPTDVPHFIIALDGVPYDVVADLYARGRFGLFHPPARVIASFPGMTDLGLAQTFHTLPCLGYEALYYDRQAGRLSSANRVYLSAANSTWMRAMDYRCSFLWDAKAYLDPRAVFEHELAGILRTFRRVERGVAVAYTVGTAGLGTRGGRPAMEKYLGRVEELCQQLVYERRGSVKITLLADHGHNLVPNERITFRAPLEAAGYRVAKKLREPRDVIPIEYGLVTYAAFYTHDPAGVADVLAQHPDVTLVCYRAAGGGAAQERKAAGARVIVQDRDGAAVVSRGAEGWRYDDSRGDPLALRPILDALQAAGRVTDDGEIDDAALFRATTRHEYPDPLRRVWEAFYGLVEHPADVIANLRDGVCHGSKFFDVMIGGAESTHGSLNRECSTTFVLTMVRRLPETLRAEEVLPAVVLPRADVVQR